jgi:hypothetical protein
VGVFCCIWEAEADFGSGGKPQLFRLRCLLTEINTDTMPIISSSCWRESSAEDPETVFSGFFLLLLQICNMISEKHAENIDDWMAVFTDANSQIPCRKGAEGLIHPR